MNSESYFISQFNNKHIGDDGAVVGEYVYSKDAFFENVHFKKEWMGHYDIAKRAMLVNVSDAVAMNAQPKFALLSVAMPADITKKEMKELAQGFQDVATKYNIEIIGGDTISNTKLDITITLISKTKKPLYRRRVKNGDLLAFTGELGRSAKELKKLFSLGKLHKKSKFLNIELRTEFMRRAGRFLGAGMDISDGLWSDLEKMTRLNAKGVHFLQHIPKSAGCSGEEYEMLVAFDARERKKVVRRAKQSRTKLSIFARIQRGRYTNRCRAHHF